MKFQDNLTGTRFTLRQDKAVVTVQIIDNISKI